MVGVRKQKRGAVEALDAGSAAPGRLIGYARVSTPDQRLDMQLDALKAAGADIVFSDVASGARGDRPGLARAIAALRQRDTLTVYKLDRLGRSVSQLSRFLDDLRAREIDFRSLTEGIDTTTSMGRAIFHILSALAEMERENICERVRAGMAAKKARGGRVGRKPVMTGERLSEAIKKLDTEGQSYRAVAAFFQCSPSALYEAVSKQRAAGLAAARKPTKAKPGGGANPPKMSENDRADVGDGALHSASIHSPKGPPTREGV